MGLLKTACDIREFAVDGHDPTERRQRERMARLEEEMRGLTTKG